MDPERFKSEALRILEIFKVRIVDFSSEAFLPYRRRGIGAVTRFDERTIYIDASLPAGEEIPTWAHELLSVYYYLREGCIRHDDEVEEEARNMAQDPACREVLQELIRHFKKATASM